MPMSRIEIQYNNREDWLAARHLGIGASEAAAVMSVSPWMSRERLWEIKTGLSESVSKDSAAKKRGRELEGALAELFFASHPEYKCWVRRPYTTVAQEERPWLFATLDSEMWISSRRTKKRPNRPPDAVLEIKTAEMYSAQRWSEWDNQIPAPYYMQVLHQFLATGCSKVYLFAYLIGKEESVVREYVFDRAEREDDLQVLLAEEIKFWASVEGVRNNALQG